MSERREAAAPEPLSLHPAVAYHVANTMGWPSLRPLQHAAVGPLRRGDHALLLAPTAGGKTEAAILPVLSTMLDEGRPALSVLYVCPLRALLNDLHGRLDQLLGLVGRRAALWHGDVGPGERQRILDDPPDLLLTTPESLEGMLVSRRVDERGLFRRLRTVIVDEIHAFAGDDRGWHLLAVLHRVEPLADRPLQRIGLSATVGNPQGLLSWLTRTTAGAARVIDPPADAGAAPDVTIDYVGNIANAAVVISRLHRGEKRLVFADSRARVEQLAVELRRHGLETYVSHGSLGRDERRRAEAAFAQASDCVIVATSTLELGIDVGDLDRVIQIDAPATVSSFLQRMGRTGRRAEAARNTLLLATSEEALVQAVALVLLWERGYIEPLEPPALPLHIAAQQVLALVLQEPGIGRHLLRDRLGHPFVLGDDAATYFDRIVAHLIGEGLLHEDGGLLGIGRRGEERFGRRHFLELLSVFTVPPTFKVFHGHMEVGEVPDTTLRMAEQKERVILLAGRSWFVRHVDWSRRVLHVEPSERQGVISWFGGSRAIDATLCRAIRDVLCGSDLSRGNLSERATRRLDKARGQFHWLRPDATVLRRREDGALHWWTFAGLIANMWLGEAIAPLLEGGGSRHNLRLRLAADVTIQQLQNTLSEADPKALTIRHELSDEAVQTLKFSDCLPPSLALDVYEKRFNARVAVAQTMAEGIGGP